GRWNRAHALRKIPGAATFFAARRRGITGTWGSAGVSDGGRAWRRIRARLRTAFARIAGAFSGTRRAQPDGGGRNTRHRRGGRIGRHAPGRRAEPRRAVSGAR